MVSKSCGSRVAEKGGLYILINSNRAQKKCFFLIDVTLCRVSLLMTMTISVGWVCWDWVPYDDDDDGGGLLTLPNDDDGNIGWLVGLVWTKNIMWSQWWGLSPTSGRASSIVFSLRVYDSCVCFKITCV